MVNLKELEEKLDLALTNETEETLTAWVEYKRRVRVKSYNIERCYNYY